MNRTGLVIPAQADLIQASDAVRRRRVDDIESSRYVLDSQFATARGNGGVQAEVLTEDFKVVDGLSRSDAEAVWGDGVGLEQK